MKVNRQNIHTLHTLLLGVFVLILTGCSPSEEYTKVKDNNFTFNSTQQQEAQSNALKHLQINYLKTIQTMSLSLETSFNELHNLYSNYTEFKSSDWENLTLKHTKILENTYIWLDKTTPPKECEEVEEQLQLLIRDTISLIIDVSEGYKTSYTIDPENIKTLETLANRLKDINKDAGFILKTF